LSTFSRRIITKTPVVARVSRPYCLYPKTAFDFWSRKEGDLPEWVQPHVHCRDDAISNATINARIRYGNL